MPKKKVFDAKKLIKMVKDEIAQAEIMKTFGFKTAVQLKNAHYRALVETGTVSKIKGGRGPGKKAAAKTVTVGKRGSIIIPKEMIAEFGLGEKDQFTLRKTKAGIALKIV
jgi:AbrB family looped-hinge helix DNA binding protein